MSAHPGGELSQSILMRVFKQKLTELFKVFLMLIFNEGNMRAYSQQESPFVHSHWSRPNYNVSLFGLMAIFENELTCVPASWWLPTALNSKWQNRKEQPIWLGCCSGGALWFLWQFLSNCSQRPHCAWLLRHTVWGIQSVSLSELWRNF